ncbi:RNA polymerase sigma factor [Rhizosphaericola mali]|uniref:RNA polymerase sigma factor n=1 Tax=Rhizosphaericola mali TaxID=2545455 RepID=A0A5P2GAI4_9BACT|nr:RNA polymerase sigma factor [Rhizosphaericola mali]QES90193.1 RNA polymerase sigma factor [Rhizosphaericola mali]
MTENDYNNCVHLYAENVFRFIIKNLRHEEDARDIVQSAFEKLWINKDKVDTEKSKSYLFTIAYNQMIDFYRKNNRISLKEDFSEDPRIVQQPDRQLKELIHNAMQKLNEVQRSLVMLKDYEGYSYEEIGAITQLSASQVKVYLHRARLTMRNYLVGMNKVL